MHRSLAATAGTLAASALLAAPALAQAPTPPGATTLTFHELDKGSTFHFVDVAPKSRRRHGFPTRISPGDQILISNPLVSDTGAPFGRLRVVCTAPIATRRFDFNCVGLFRLPAGDIWAAATRGASNTTSGAIIGGTGAYAGARGIFRSVSTRSGADDTLTLMP
jgi:hypothetical protein